MAEADFELLPRDLNTFEEQLIWALKKVIALELTLFIETI
jgi:hypothetical protein